MVTSGRYSPNESTAVRKSHTGSIIGSDVTAFKLNYVDYNMSR